MYLVQYTQLENDPEYILKALSLGYDCEVDIWLVEKELYLGHDEPTYKTNMDFLLQHEKYLWVHCKNFEALELLNKIKELIIFGIKKTTLQLQAKVTFGLIRVTVLVIIV